MNIFLTARPSVLWGASVSRLPASDSAAAAAAAAAVLVQALASRTLPTCILTVLRNFTPPSAPPQMIALFRDYDVIWPGATNTALGYFEIVNVGLSMAAPGGIPAP